MLLFQFRKDDVQSFPICETCAIFYTSLLWVLRLRLTSLLYQPVASPMRHAGPFAKNVCKTFSLRSVLQVRTSSPPAGGQVSLDSCQIYCFGIHYKSIWDVTMMCLLILPIAIGTFSLISGSCSSVPRFVVLLPLLPVSRQTSLQLTNVKLVCKD